MPERVQNEEIWTRDTSHASIAFAEFSSLTDSNDQPIPIAEALRMQYREYTEVPYYRGEMRREYGMEGPRVMVGAYKTAILSACVEWLQDHTPAEPLPFEKILASCMQAAPFDLSSVSDIEYVPNPKYGNDDKARLQYRPDFDAIHAARSPVKVEEQHARLAFYQSLYAIQKFAAGIRCDIFGGSGLIKDKPTWENRDEEFELKPVQQSNTYRWRCMGRQLLRSMVFWR